MGKTSFRIKEILFANTISSFELLRPSISRELLLREVGDVSNHVLFAKYKRRNMRYISNIACRFVIVSSCLSIQHELVSPEVPVLYRMSIVNHVSLFMYLIILLTCIDYSIYWWFIMYFWENLLILILILISSYYVLRLT